MGPLETKLEVKIETKHLKKNWSEKVIQKVKIRQKKKNKDLNAINQACPLKKQLENKFKREELGRGTWNLIHSITFKYPESPSQDDKKDAMQFINLLAKLYPCQECSMHF